MQDLVIRLGKNLKAREWKLASAESCTGGGLAFHVTSIAGSSEWFERGFVTYSNLSKQEMLGVRHATLMSFGAVSEETAREMAEGVLSASQAQISVAITGIAGPDGGTAEKPVGTVSFAFAGINFETISKTENLSGDRAEVRNKSIEVALRELLKLSE